MSNEHKLWASAPKWAKWHTWDKLGKTWWQLPQKEYQHEAVWDYSCRSTLA